MFGLESFHVPKISYKKSFGNVTILVRKSWIQIRSAFCFRKYIRTSLRFLKSPKPLQLSDIILIPFIFYFLSPKKVSSFIVYLSQMLDLCDLGHVSVSRMITHCTKQPIVRVVPVGKHGSLQISIVNNKKRQTKQVQNKQDITNLSPAWERKKTAPLIWDIEQRDVSSKTNKKDIHPLAAKDLHTHNRARP